MRGLDCLSNNFSLSLFLCWSYFLLGISARPAIHNLALEFTFLLRDFLCLQIHFCVFKQALQFERFCGKKVFSKILKNHYYSQQISFAIQVKQRNKRRSELEQQDKGSIKTHKKIQARARIILRFSLV